MLRPRLPDQPLAKSVQIGKTLDLFAGTYDAGVPLQGYWMPPYPYYYPPPSPQVWPAPIWASSNEAVATVAILAGSVNTARITPVGLGTTIITATVAGQEQRFIVDVVPAEPTDI